MTQGVLQISESVASANGRHQSPIIPAAASFEIASSKNTNENRKDQGANANSVEDQRPKWSNGLEFLMSCISMSIGLGNIWRFPFTAYENGGGAFLIPYLVVLLVIGKPMYYLEMVLGQFSSKGPVKIWSLCPSFLGVGYGHAFGTISIITYYSSLIALTLYYMIASFQSVLPWTYCRAQWMPLCVDSLATEETSRISANISQTEKLHTSSELYFLQEVIKEKTQIDDGIGLPDAYLSVSLLVAWIIIFLVISKGVKSSGKAAYFLALFPYVVLIALLVRSVTLEGAKDGIIFFLKPKWSELLNPKVWKEAVVQCFFSLAVGLGPVIMFSSYNRFDHNIYRDAMIVTSLDMLTSLLAGITIFGILGNLAYNLHISDIQEVVRSGAGLAFISYPDAIAKFHFAPQVFSVLFFFMLLVLGIGSVVALQSSICTVICDQFPHFKFWIVALVTCIIGCLLGLVYMTPGGQWILNLVDFYGGTYVVFGLAILEVIGVAWIYGLENFCDDVEFMTNKRVSAYWQLCWKYFTPLLMLIIFIYSMITIQPLTYGGSLYPNSANIIGWLLFAFGISQFPLWALWYLKTHYQDNWKKTICQSLLASEKWGPTDQDTKVRWLIFKQQLAEQRLLHNNNNKNSHQQSQRNGKLLILWQQMRNVFGKPD